MTLVRAYLDIELVSAFFPAGPVHAKNVSAIPICLLIAFFSLLTGAYSEPYFGEFDPLFFAGLLPYLSTFELASKENVHALS